MRWNNYYFRRICSIIFTINPCSQMDAKTLFTSPYDQKTFVKLLKDLLWEEYQDEWRYETKEIWQGFEYITHYSRLGAMELDNWWYKEQVLVLEITQRSINDARVSITKETIKLLKKDIFQWYYTVLVSFRSDANPNNWRFSLIKSNDGKTWNNAKRFSYYLGKNEGYKTPKQYLIDAGQIKDLNDLVSRFDVEVVRKEFFNLYINLFLELYQEVKKYQYCFQSINTGSIIDLVAFSKNLMGKMIFLYFIQKKGRLWLTADQNFKDHPGDPQFFKNNFDTRLARDWDLFHCAINFYNDFLEPLFYSGLNKKNPNDWHEVLQMKVPYLNWWLFEEEYKDRETILLPLENNLFKAIVDAFDTYNFTIDENDPMDQEIAVDPEMLGKIFEYMISIDNEKIGDLVDLYNQKKKFKEYPSPDRSVNIVAEIKKNKEINKKLGAFYTPREIVQYMTREALMYSMIEFLSKKLPDKTNEELEAIVRDLRHCKDKHLTTKDEIEDREWQVATYQTLKSVAFDLKEYLLYDKNSEIKPLSILDPAVWSGAFPMGILQEMTGLVEYLIDTFGLEKKSRYEIKQSIIRDSIYGIDIDPGAVDIARLRFWLSLIVDAPEPIPLPNLEFKFVCANSLIPLENDSLFTNKDVIEKLRTIKNEYFKTSDNDRKEELKTEFDTLKSDLLWFSHKMRYDFKSTKEYKKYIEDLVKQNTDAKNRQFQEWDPFDTSRSNSWFDSEMMFNTGKFDIVIWNPPYWVSLKGLYRNIVTKYLGKVPDFEIYYHFVELGKKFLKTRWILTYIIPNTFLFNVFAKNYRISLLDDRRIYAIQDCTNFDLFENATVRNAIPFLVNDNPTNNVKYKKTAWIEQYVDFIQQNDFIVTRDILLENIKNRWLVFKLPRKILDIVKKIKDGGSRLWDICPEYSQWLIAYDKYQWTSEFDIKNRSFHFQSYRDGLKKRLRWEDVTKYNVTRNGKEYIDYSAAIANPRDPKFFKWKRIVIREITNPSIYAALIDEEMYHDPSVIVFLENTKQDDYKIEFILWILNSALWSFFHFNSSSKASKWSFPKILVEDIKEFPIKYGDEKKQEDISDLVNEIIKIKKLDLQGDTLNLERKIDILVYKLYELTLEDSQIIDPTLTKEEWDIVNFD